MSLINDRAFFPNVAPLVGAWIEMSGNLDKYDYAIVAPLVGAWIEINKHLFVVLTESSLLSWERGLKFPRIKLVK